MLSLPYQNETITKNTKTLHKMEALTQSKKYLKKVDEVKKNHRQKIIIENYKEFSIKDLAEICDYPEAKLKAQYSWLVRKGIIDKKSKPINKNANIIEINNDNDINTTFDNIQAEIDKYRIRTGKNTYANHKGLNKDIARSKWVKYIIESGLVGKLPSLMNTEVSGEREILNALPGMEIFGVECDKPTLNNLRQVIRKAKLPIETFKGFVHEFMYGVESNTYAHMILDYCGCLSTKTKELEYTINNNLVQVGGYIALTIKREIRQTNSDNAKRLLSLTNTISNVGIYNNVTDSEKLNEIYIQKLLGFNYQLVEVFNYRDTTNMTLFMIKRIK
jgi:hypothetical protein